MQDNTYHNSSYYIYKAKSQKDISIDESRNCNDDNYLHPMKTEPSIINSYEVDYSSPFTFPSYSTYRNLLANKYDEGEHHPCNINQTEPSMSKSDKERLIEEIKAQVKKEKESSLHQHYNTEHEDSKVNQRAQYQSIMIEENDYAKTNKPKAKYEPIDISKLPELIKHNEHAEPSMKMNSSELSIHQTYNAPSIKSNMSQSNLNSNSNNNNQGIEEGMMSSMRYKNQVNDLRKENELLRVENTKLQNDNKQLRQELNEMRLMQGNNNITQPREEESVANDEFKNYLMQENERLTKALKERYSLYTTAENTMPSQGVDGGMIEKVKKKKKKIKKRGKSKKEFLTIQSSDLNTNTQETKKQYNHIHHNNNKKQHVPYKRTEYDIHSSERAKTCIACLMGSHKYTRAYSPKESYNVHTIPNNNYHTITTTSNHIKKTRSKSKSKSKSITKPKTKQRNLDTNQ